MYMENPKLVDFLLKVQHKPFQELLCPNTCISAADRIIYYLNIFLTNYETMLAVQNSTQKPSSNMCIPSSEAKSASSRSTSAPIAAYLIQVEGVGDRH